MLILAIETTGPLASCALGAEDGAVQLVNTTKYSHLEEIAPMAKRILEENGSSPAELSAIAVSRGPGSFTGVRIGMATVKGLAEVWDKPVIEVPTLASFAFADCGWLPEGKKRLFCPIFDARRDQVYAGVYEPGNDRPAIEDSACDFRELLEKIRALISGYEEICFFGDAIAIYGELIESSGLPYVIAPEEHRYQMAEAVLRLGVKLYNEGKLSDAFTCKPEYLRLAEAERKLLERQARENAGNGGKDR